jgi:lipopolysaccharide transport system permease protein
MAIPRFAISVRRDVVTVYKQTVLEPLWYLIQLFTSITFTIVLIISLELVLVRYPLLFNLASITIWNYFSTCLRNIKYLW